MLYKTTDFQNGNLNQKKTVMSEDIIITMKE